MRPGTAALCALTLALPVSVEWPADPDSGWGETTASIYGSVGRLAVIDRGCEGQVLGTHPREYEEIAGEIHHRFENGITLGVRGGEISEHAESRITVYDYDTYPYSESTFVQRYAWKNRYVNPSVGIERGPVGIGVGFIASEKDFPMPVGPPEKIEASGHLRLGSLDGAYFKVSYMENVPLYAGGGYLETGLGLHPHRNLHAYVGLSGSGPYDGTGLKMELDYRVARHVALSGRARYGSSGGESQSGIALGVTYTTRPPVQPGRRERSDRDDGEGASGSAWGLSKPPDSEPRSEEPPPLPPSEPPDEKPPIEKLPKYGEYQDVDSLPQLLSGGEPVPADSARGDGVTGTVTLAALVGWDGAVRETRVLVSVPGLDEAAIARVRTWRFRPATRDGRAVAYWMAVPVRFE